MRTVVAYLREASSVELRLWMQRNYAQGPDVWLVTAAGDAVLYMRVEEPLQCQPWDLGDPGFLPASCLVIDVSGRHDGTTEVKAVLEKLLTVFSGVADDGYADACWTLDELRADARKGGHPFFDYRGWRHGSGTEDQRSI